MSESVQRILDLLDSSNQVSMSREVFGLDPAPLKCVRCYLHRPVLDGDICKGCREFLLEDSDYDPKPRPPLSAEMRTTQ